MKRDRRNKGRVKKGNRRYESLKKNSAPPKTREAFLAMPQHSQERWTRVANIISKMRSDRLSLAKASREFGEKPATVVKYASGALRKLKNGRYAVRPSDRLLRVIFVLTPTGTQEIAVRDSHQATTVAEHWNAVHRYLQTGDETALKAFRHTRVNDAEGNAIPLLTDFTEIDRLGSAGVLSFESLYARTA